MGAPASEEGGPAGTSGGRRRAAWVVAGVLVAVVLSVGAVVALAATRGGDEEPADDNAAAEDAGGSGADTEGAGSADAGDEERGGSEPDGDYDAQGLAEQFGDAVWEVEAEGCGVTSAGTAFAVSDRELVTNWHVTSVSDTPTLRSRDGEQQLRATVLGWSIDPDIALLEVDEPLDVHLDWVDADDLEAGEMLVALGYPLPDGDFTVTPATVMSFQTAGGRREAIRADARIDKGNSGGPALTSDGQVAGVATEMEPSGGFQLVPLIYTHDYLREELAAFKRDRLGVEVDCEQAGLLPTLPEDWEPWEPPEAYDEPWEYGDDKALDALWDACADADWAACDNLYWGSPLGSVYEAFAESCGDRDVALPGSCEHDMGRQAYGDDAGLDALWDGCADGDWAACDELYWDSPYGSDYEWFGATCGERDDPRFGDCWRRDGGASADGGGPDLSGLRDACTDGDMGACDDLYWQSPLHSDDERFGSTCGERAEETYGGCATP